MSWSSMSTFVRVQARRYSLQALGAYSAYMPNFRHTGRRSELVKAACLARADCQYNPTGTYAEPASREAFAMASNRKDFASAFYTPELVAWRDTLLKCPHGSSRVPAVCPQQLRTFLFPLNVDTSKNVTLLLRASKILWCGRRMKGAVYVPLTTEEMDLQVRTVRLSHHSCILLVGSNV